MVLDAFITDQLGVLMADECTGSAVILAGNLSLFLYIVQNILQSFSVDDQLGISNSFLARWALETFLLWLLKSNKALLANVVTAFKDAWFPVFVCEGSIAASALR
jgi:hypothetical protein